jgi:hypothetical protein
MNTHNLKIGDRVYVTTANRVRGCTAGHRGTIVRLPAAAGGLGEPYSVVQLDRDHDGPGVIFTPEEIAPVPRYS